MKLEVKTVFLLLALLCFIGKALNIPVGRIDLMNAGFACVVAAFLFG